eukprot:TRINITY_DN10233_c0_g1_i4.p1 TRINITY_DN10233_c0_g1~~TRINITY_DN10233_c0_g1_i4.p1  ORF type:complete len:1181 (+),score=260.61 TRINITY_DN10233_c0_g1_i4:164-3544(+)
MRKLMKTSSATVMARVGPLLADDDNDEAAAALAAAETGVDAGGGNEALGSEDGESEWSRRAAVLLALTRDLAESQRREKREKSCTSADSKSMLASGGGSGLANAIQAVSVGSQGDASFGPDDEDRSSGDGTGWSARFAKLENKTASEEELARWMQEASDLLASMGREERSESANELGQFVKKCLQVFHPTDCSRLVQLGVDRAVNQLWCQIRFAEAKPLFGRLLSNELQAQIKVQDSKFDTEPIWVEKAAQLVGGELSEQRTHIIDLLMKSRRLLSRVLAKLLRAWHQQSAGEKELASIQKAIELLHKTWKAGDCPAAWFGFSNVHGIVKACADVMQACQKAGRPKSAQKMRELLQKLQADILPARVIHVLSSRATNDLRTLVAEVQTSPREDEVTDMQMHHLPLIRLLSALMEGLPDSNDELCYWFPESKKLNALAADLASVRLALPEVSQALDKFLMAEVPAAAALLHKAEWCQDGAKKESDQRALASSSCAMQWAERVLKELLESGTTSSMDRHRACSLMTWEILGEVVSEYSQRLNLILKSLHALSSLLQQALHPAQSQWSQFLLELQSYIKFYVDDHAQRQDEVARWISIERSIKSAGLRQAMGHEQVRRCIIFELAPEFVSPGHLEESLKSALESCQLQNDHEAMVAAVRQGAKMRHHLAPGWRESHSRAGLRFFQNKANVETRWDRPTLISVSAEESLAGVPVTPRNQEESGLATPKPRVFTQRNISQALLAAQSGKHPSTTISTPSPKHVAKSSNPGTAIPGTPPGDDSFVPVTPTRSPSGRIPKTLGAGTVPERDQAILPKTPVPLANSAATTLELSMPPETPASLQGPPETPVPLPPPPGTPLPLPPSTPCSSASRGRAQSARSSSAPTSGIPPLTPLTPAPGKQRPRSPELERKRPPEPERKRPASPQRPPAPAKVAKAKGIDSAAPPAPPAPPPPPALLAPPPPPVWPVLPVMHQPALAAPPVPPPPPTRPAPQSKERGWLHDDKRRKEPQQNWNKQWQGHEYGSSWSDDQQWSQSKHDWKYHKSDDSDRGQASWYDQRSWKQSKHDHQQEMWDPSQAPEASSAWMPSHALPTPSPPVPPAVGPAPPKAPPPKHLLVAKAPSLIDQLNAEPGGR